MGRELFTPYKGKRPFIARMETALKYSDPGIKAAREALKSKKKIEWDFPTEKQRDKFIDNNRDKLPEGCCWGRAEKAGSINLF